MKSFLDEIIRILNGLILGIACAIVGLFALNWQQFLPAPGNNTVPPAGITSEAGSGMPAGSYLTEEKVRSVVTDHVTKLYPELQVGSITDTGRFFEAKILSKDNVVVRRIGMEKDSGRLIELN